MFLPTDINWKLTMPFEMTTAVIDSNQEYDDLSIAVRDFKQEQLRPFTTA